MYLKKIKLSNYRKFSTENNIVEFISSKLVQTEEINEDTVTSDDDKVAEESGKHVDIASDTTLIIGKNNAGKTTIITALDNLINHANSFGANDFNFRYLQTYLNNYDIDNPPGEAPYIEFIISIELEEASSDRISNLIPFMLIEDVKGSEINICIRYEIEDLASFQQEMKELLKNKDEETFGRFIVLLQNTDFTLNYYDKNFNRLDTNFKISNLMELQCIKANHLKNDNCLTEAFNTIIGYRYEHIFFNEKKAIIKELEKINNGLTEHISKSHTDVIKSVLNELVSMEQMGVDLSADITFEKLMKDLIKYEYVEDEANIPENQFGLGYTHLVMIIAAIMDYMERYPDSSFNSKINLISIEEPETFMHPQMQELFIKNINEAIRILLSSRDKNVNSQIIITTHSSHILNSKIHSANTFNNICYLHELGHNAQVTNLCNKKVMPDIDEKSEDFKFLKKHIKYKVSELFFSDAAIFVEGFAEDTLMPYYIENREKLGKHYISVFNINGAHGFLYKNLIKALGVPVVMITDLDIKRKDEDVAEDASTAGKPSVYEQVKDLKGKQTTNETIINIWGQSDLSTIPTAIQDSTFYLAYQGKVNEYYATSFEEAFILTNYNNVITNELLEEMKPNIYKSIVGKEGDYKKNIDNSYKWQVKLSKNKGEFASKLLYKIVNAKTEQKIPELPKYITDGLEWMEKMLGGR